MGIENRDYVRRGSGGNYGRGFGNPGDNWAINFLLIANVAVFILQNMDLGGVTDALELSLWDIQHFQIWRLVTYGFCHGGIWHIAINMYVLWMFGRLVEPIYGSREFLAFYLVGIVISGLCHIGIQLVDGSLNPVIGASGGVNAVVFLCAMLYPRMTVLFMFDSIPVDLVSFGGRVCVVRFVRVLSILKIPDRTHRALGGRPLGWLTNISAGVLHPGCSLETGKCPSGLQRRIPKFAPIVLPKRTWTAESMKFW